MSVAAPRTVLVVGAGHGIGAGIAAAFAAEGDRVVVADLDPAAAEVVAAGLGADASWASVDVTDESSVDTLLAEHPDAAVVVNAAGVYPNTPVEEMTLQEWRHVMDVNATGAFLVGRAAARTMRTAAVAGRIVMITSGAATSARVGAAHYCASKAALDMIVRVLALELAGTGITVNAVAPGLVEVERLADLDPDYIAVLLGELPVPRLGRPADIAAACRFLAGDDASYVTGSVLTVDGGYAAGRPLPRSHPRPPTIEEPS